MVTLVQKLLSNSFILIYEYLMLWEKNALSRLMPFQSERKLFERSHRNFIVNIDRIVNKMYSFHRAVNIFVVLCNCSVLFCAKLEENYTIADYFVSKHIMVDNRQVQNITFDDIKKHFKKLGRNRNLMQL